ncbi:MAG: LOG family protein [Proteobacteria bacterium]|nr:LOG family protein [Pseudomonadota bacterium]
MASKVARELRILSEYIEPEARFEEFQVRDTVVFFGSARIKCREDAEKDLEAATKNGGDIKAAERDLKMSSYYENARQLAFRLTKWSKNLEGDGRRFIVCSGGGPGIMEAANRGASEAAGINAGLNISLPHEQNDNPYITRALNFEFHYFFMRKFWFIYLAKAIIVFPGGFGTMDEFFEVLTLMQTGKLSKPIPIVLYGKDFWSDVLNLDALVKHGTINAEDLNLFFQTDSLDDAFDFITKELLEKALATPGGKL